MNFSPAGETRPSTVIGPHANIWLSGSEVTAPAAVLIRPDGYVAWVGDMDDAKPSDALTTWFGPPG